MSESEEVLKWIESRPWTQWYDEFVPRELEIPEKPLFHLLDYAADRHPGHTAMIFFDNKISYGRFRGEANKFARALYELGVRKGDKVALFLPNTPQFAIAYYGTLKAGAVVTPMNPLYKPEEVKRQLNDSGAETLVILDLLYPVFEEVSKDTPVKRVIVTSIRDYLSGLKRLLYPLKYKSPKIPRREGVYWFRELIERYPPSPPEVEIDPKEDLAALMYTGGTTGIPKGAMLTHYNLYANTLQTKSWLHPEREAEETVISLLPWFHIYGQTVCLNYPIAKVATMVVFPRFDLEAALKAVEKYKANQFPGVPTIYVQIINSPLARKYNLRSLEACISGAAPLPVEVLKKFEELTGARLREGYGLTETSPVTHVNPIYGKYKPGSIGVPVPNTLAAIADINENKLLPVGEVGELVISGPQVMKGYYKRPEENKQVFFELGGYRWLRTGDIAKMDEEGYFYIVDRKKDLIKYKGYSVYPREVEEVLYQHPAVKEAAVIGVPDPEVGEQIKAFIVLKEEYKGKVSEEDIKRWAKERLAAYKYPRIVEFRDELPKSAVGKILRRVLREEEIRKYVKDIIKEGPLS